MEVWSKVMETGATPPVDIYPFLHWLPQSFFLNWRDRATHVQKEMNHLYADFLRDIRARRSKSGSRGCFMDKVLDQADSEKRMEGLTYNDHELWFMGGTLTEGGSDTSASIITAFVQAMAAHPEVQRKAQAQIDGVVGEDRSPTWQDYARLPYVAHCVKETMRWRPVTPLAFPHALAEDDWVDGKLLPKGTVIIVNAWGMHFDPARYQNPEAFDPDHFAGCTALATELANGSWEKRDHYGYGTGRRFCPGAHLAERNLFLAMAKLLWAFEITPGMDRDGSVVQPDMDPVTGYSEGFLTCANEFKAGFKVRGEERKATILEEFEQANNEVFGKYEASGEEAA
jgi:cytochrome P450 family 619